MPKKKSANKKLTRHQKEVGSKSGMTASGVNNKTKQDLRKKWQGRKPRN